MKEWCLKHPVLTFILVDLTAYNAFTLVNNIVKVVGSRSETKEDKEENDNEPSGDIQ